MVFQASLMSCLTSVRSANAKCQVLARLTTLHIETIKALEQLVGIVFAMLSDI